MAKIIISYCSVHFKRFYLSFLRQPGFCLLVCSYTWSEKLLNLNIFRYENIEKSLICAYTLSVSKANEMTTIVIVAEDTPRVNIRAHL